MASYENAKVLTSPPVHLLVKREGRLATIGCATPVGSPSQYTTLVVGPRGASCKKCAKHAEGLSDAERIEIWQNANERLGIDRPSPWEREQAKKARAEAREKRKAEKAARAAARKAKAAAVAPF